MNYRQNALDALRNWAEAKSSPDRDKQVDAADKMAAALSGAYDIRSSEVTPASEDDAAPGGDLQAGQADPAEGEAAVVESGPATLKQVPGAFPPPDAIRRDRR